MTYASIHDIAASWESYPSMLAPLVDPAPDGLVLYLAGPTDEGVRILAVWDRADALERYDRRLAPAIAAHAAPVSPVWTTRTVHVVHLVAGPGIADPAAVPNPVHVPTKESSC